MNTMKPTLLIPLALSFGLATLIGACTDEGSAIPRADVAGDVLAGTDDDGASDDLGANDDTDTTAEDDALDDTLANDASLDEASPESHDSGAVDDTAGQETDTQGLDTQAQDSDAVGDGDGTSSPDIPAGVRATMLWRGMDHEWLRSIVGFKVPHRVSKLDSYLGDETHTGGETDWSGSAPFNVGQSTGVDGNYMKPVGHFGAFLSQGALVHRGATTLSWTDDTEGSDYPRAESTQTQMVTVPLNGAPLDPAPDAQYQAVLRGIQLETACDDTKQPTGANPCNSDGMWPFRMSIDLGTCNREGQVLLCPLDVKIGRAWTPNLGGLPPIEEKPYNERLDFELTVHYAIIGGSPNAIRITHGPDLTASGEARDSEPTEMAGLIEGVTGFPLATLGVTAFGFEFAKLPAQNQPKFDHLGRYIGRIRFEVAQTTYTPSDGQLDYAFNAQVWVPDTVANAAVSYTHRVALIQLASGQVAAPGQVSGVVCRNSTDQAPFFSKWTKCDEPDKGPEQAEDSVPVVVP